MLNDLYVLVHRQKRHSCVLNPNEYDENPEEYWSTTPQQFEESGNQVSCLSVYASAPDAHGPPSTLPSPLPVVPSEWNRIVVFFHYGGYYLHAPNLGRILVQDLQRHRLLGAEAYEFDCKNFFARSIEGNMTVWGYSRAESKAGEPAARRYADCVRLCFRSLNDADGPALVAGLRNAEVYAMELLEQRNAILGAGFANDVLAEGCQLAKQLGREQEDIYLRQVAHIRGREDALSLGNDEEPMVQSNMVQAAQICGDQAQLLAGFTAGPPKKEPSDKDAETWGENRCN